MNRQRRFSATVAAERVLRLNFNDSDDSSNEESDDEETDSEVDEAVENVLTSEESSDEEDSLDRPNADNPTPTLNSGPHQSTLSSKNGTILWNSMPEDRRGRARAVNVLRQTPGPTRYISQNCSSAQDCFMEFITTEMLNEIVSSTNERGRLHTQNWIDTDIEEITKFIGALLLAGVYLSKNEPVAQLWNRQDGRPIFSQIMSRNRFSQLTSALRFDERSTRNERRSRDKLAPIRTIWNKFIVRCRRNYIPNDTMTVDEQLLTFRGRCSFKMFIPSKPGRYGIKIWALCDADNNYFYNGDVYTGRQGTQREVNQSMRVVLELTEPISNTARNIVGDNFFSSVPLVKSLLARNLTYFGTIRQNKPELPQAFQPNRFRDPESTLFGFNDNITIVSYVPKRKKAVNLISTFHHTAEISNNRGKPQVIIDYNSCKSGVDTLDQNVRKYSCKRRTRRWPMALFYNILDIAAFNSFVIFRNLHPGWHLRKPYRRRLFLITLARQLAGIEGEDSQLRRTDRPIRRTATVSATGDDEPAAKKSRCSLCGWRQDRKTRTKCSSCQTHVCNEHSSVICARCKDDIE